MQEPSTLPHGRRFTSNRVVRSYLGGAVEVKLVVEEFLFLGFGLGYLLCTLVEYLWSAEKFQEGTRKTEIVNVEDLGWP